MFIEGSDLWKQWKAKMELRERIQKGVYTVDWRNGCDGHNHTDHHVRINLVSFQTNLNDEQLSEDSYCIDCIYKQIYEELFN